MASKTILLISEPLEHMRVRLDTHAVAVRDLWFPTRAEMIGWQESDKNLFVRWTHETSFETGFRQETMAAARLAPHWYVTIQPEKDSCVAEIHSGFPKITRNVLLFLAITMLAWGAVVSEQWTEVWWGTAATLSCTVLIAWVWGQRQLTAGWGQLEEVLRGPS